MIRKNFWLLFLKNSATGDNKVGIESSATPFFRLGRLGSYFRLMRLHQPIGIWLLFLPCLFGVVMSVKAFETLNIFAVFQLISLFFFGSLFMRSAGCVINDILDREFDQKTARTKSRPLASGEVSLIEALILLAVLLILGSLILFRFNDKAILSGFVAAALVFLYPLAKRFTNYPQVVLGIAFNFGVIMSALEISEKISVSVLLLYFSAIIWTVIYDTIYAFQDIEDDLKTGVKSTAVKFSKSPKKILVYLGFSMFLTLAIIGWIENYKLEFFLAILLSDMVLNYQIQRWDVSNPESCLKTFKSNIWIGLIILIAFFFG
jgi:4-hydroxybenzoate polyprenyltransferase